ncbi:MAG: hypothetical protein ACYCSR_13900 [Thiomonas sp.]
MHVAPQVSPSLEPSIMVKPHAVTARKALLTLAFIGASAPWLMGVAKTVASFTASGPLCYVKLPAGTYTVMGTHHGQTRSIQVHAGSMNQSLRW